MYRRSLRESFSYAIQGIFYALLSQRNMKIHSLAAVVVVASGFYFDISRIEWAIIMLTVFMVLAAEVTNTAIEKTVDLFTREYHPLAKLAKNLAAGGVLLTAITAVIVAVLIFGPYLLKRF